MSLILRDFTTTTTEDGKRIVRAGGCVSDSADHEKRKEWIDFQVSIDLPTVRNGALQRREVLKQVSEELFRIAKDFESLSGPRE